jgi:hypothetical protein
MTRESVVQDLIRAGKAGLAGQVGNVAADDYRFVLTFSNSRELVAFWDGAMGQGRKGTVRPALPLTQTFNSMRKRSACGSPTRMHA